jgi:hypothetical protein
MGCMIMNAAPGQTPDFAARATRYTCRCTPA